MLRSKSNVGRADKEHALKKNQKQSTYQCIALDLFLMRMPLRGVLLLLLLSRSDVKTSTQDNKMPANDNNSDEDTTEEALAIST